MDNDLLSAQDVADILKIARNTVYELIKRGELNSSKVGKQVRVTRQEVSAYLKRTANADAVNEKMTLSAPAAGRNIGKPIYTQVFEENIHGNEFIICGQDIALDILANHLNTALEGLQVYRSSLGSYNGIYALYQGRVHVATSHLWDGDLDDYNVSYVKKMMPGIPACTMRIGKRWQGFYVQKGNPKGISGWKDLKRPDLSIVNREKGSGTRVLLDEKLRLMGVIGEYIEGYYHECKSHLAVASIVSHGDADLGIGCETGGKNINGIDFIPLQQECYDLIVRMSDVERQPYRTILEIVSSPMFRRDLESIGGYDCQETGKIIWG